MNYIKRYLLGGALKSLKSGVDLNCWELFGDELITGAMIPVNNSGRCILLILTFIVRISKTNIEPITRIMMKINKNT